MLCAVLTTPLGVFGTAVGFVGVGVVGLGVTVGLGFTVGLGVDTAGEDLPLVPPVLGLPGVRGLPGAPGLNLRVSGA